MSREALFLLHSGIPRQAPGSDASTAEAIRRLPNLPAPPRILDAGCGPGKQTLVLARTLRAPVEAVDIHQPYLDELAQAAHREGLAEFITPRHISMDALDYPAHHFDLIWSEGAAYILGISAAMRCWRPLLRPDGMVAFTELTWMCDDPPEPARTFWNAAHPEMATAPRNIVRIEAEGYHVFDTFALPASDWWGEYLTPLQDRIRILRPQADAALAQVLDEAHREIDICSGGPESFGYVFYFARKADAA